MQTLDVFKCLAARNLIPTHGVRFAASFLNEQSIPFAVALDFLTSREETVCLKYLSASVRGNRDEPPEQASRSAKY